jgi:hypothetical protein
MTVQGNEFSVGNSSFVVKEGRVGIRTSSPSEALDVTGEIVASSITLTATGPNVYSLTISSSIRILAGGISFKNGSTLTTIPPNIAFSTGIPQVAASGINTSWEILAGSTISLTTNGGRVDMDYSCSAGNYDTYIAATQLSFFIDGALAGGQSSDRGIAYTYDKNSSMQKIITLAAHYTTPTSLSAGMHKFSIATKTTSEAYAEWWLNSEANTVCIFIVQEHL